MDLKICGIIDIVIVVGAVIAMIIGFKKGFMSKVISFIGVLAILLFAIFYCTQFAQFLIKQDFVYPTIYNNMATKINSELATLGEDATVSQLIQTGLGAPKFIADLIAKAMGDPQTEDIVVEVCTYAATEIMNVIAFLIMFFGGILLLIIVKIIIKAVRSSAFIRIVDGVLGAVLYVAIFLVIVTALFSLLHIVMDQSWFANAKSWLTVDMQLDNDSAVRISKTLYQENFFVKLYNLIF